LLTAWWKTSPLRVSGHSIRGFGLCGPLARFGGDLWRPVSTMQTDCEPPPEDDRLDAAADQAIAACGGIARDAVKALLVANEVLEARVAELQAAASTGYSGGRFEPPPRDRKVGTTEMSQVTYYVALPFVSIDGGLATGEPVECFNPTAVVKRAEALSRKEGHVGAIAFAR
jgi:hypothetical protein